MAEFDTQSGINIGMVQDVQNLDKLRQMSLSKEGKQGALMAAARQFESIFTQTLFKGMRQANSVLTEGNPMNSSYTQFYEGMLDEQRVADMSSKGGLGIAEMVARQLSPEKTFTHQDGRVLKLPERTERVYKPYQPPSASNDLIAASKVGKDFADNEMKSEMKGERRFMGDLERIVGCLRERVNARRRTAREGSGRRPRGTTRAPRTSVLGGRNGEPARGG